MGIFEAAAEVGGGAEAAKLGDAFYWQGCVTQIVCCHLQADLHEKCLKCPAGHCLYDLADILLAEMQFFCDLIQACALVVMPEVFPDEKVPLLDMTD